MDTFRNGAAYQEWSYIYVQCTDSICWMLCVHSTTHTEGGRICFWYCRECIFEGSPEEATWSWQAHLLFSLRESPSSTFYYLCKIVRCTDTGLKNTGFIIGTIYMRCVRNMFAFNGPHYLLDGTSEQELKCKLPSIAASSSSLHITVSAAHLILHCTRQRKVVVGISHLLQIQKVGVHNVHIVK